MDPQFAAMLGLGLVEGTQVSPVQRSETRLVDADCCLASVGVYRAVERSADGHFG